MAAEPPCRRIVAEIRSRVLSGELRPGERMPSIRQIVQRWGVAIATATRVMATLRDEGLVEAKVGSGTVVSGRQPRVGAPKRTLSRGHLLRTAIAIADVEGLDAVSMRQLGSGPMSLYRHVATKDELITQMVDVAFGEPELPDPGLTAGEPDSN
ncbi:TetR/AcrR family transcriptional regulator [Nonomuraea antri]|uniref:TetR/AcrR family transcriptional regulator n=1 Tax=Nonomuraea antri TaxID=2730852 RepID=UPI001C2BAE67|nr:winged helix-turn-helix domain-containing protein [Nonomuraea antri]